MAKKSRTEITVETDRRFVIRHRRKTPEAWCAQCASPARMVSPEEAADVGGWRLRAVYRWIETGAVHFTEHSNGFLLVCLNSLRLIKATSPVSAATSDQLPIEASLSLLRPRYHGEGVGDPPTAGIHAAAPDRFIALSLKPDAEPCLPQRKRTWVLTTEAFSRLLACLSEDRETAGEEYERIRFKLIKYFECRGCLSPEDQADETINRVARRIGEGQEIWTTNACNYFYGVARNVLREYWTSPERDVSLLECDSAAADPPEGPTVLSESLSEWSLEPTLQALERCMEALPAESHEMILEYYEGERGDKIRNRKRLAAQLGIQPNALRIRVHRIRERLERDVTEQLEGRVK